MKPQNQVTVRSSETGDVFRISRGFAERHLDILTILDDIKAWDEVGGFIDGALPEAGWHILAITTPVQSADTPVDPIAAPVADDK